MEAVGGQEEELHSDSRSRSRDPQYLILGRLQTLQRVIEAPQLLLQPPNLTVRQVEAGSRACRQLP